MSFRYLKKIFVTYVLVFFSFNTGATLGIRCEGFDCENYYYKSDVSSVFKTPTKELTPNEYPDFVDDLNFEGISLALERQLKRFEKMKLNGTIQYGTKIFPLTKVKESLELFLVMINNFKSCSKMTDLKVCQKNFQNNIIKDFYVFIPNLNSSDSGFGKDEYTFFTGYYTPLLKVKKVESKEFSHGIYSMPKNTKLLGSTRDQIDFEHVLKQTLNLLFWTNDLFDHYIMQIEGGGKVYIEETNESYYLSFAGTNKKSFRFISKYMKEKGYISNGSVKSQEDFLKRNPNLQREIYNYCPNYVYWKITDHPPYGSDSVSLTDNRSIATDSSLYTFKGGLSFISSYRPVEKNKNLENTDVDINLKYKPFSRFVLDQDTGGAIKGKARVDIYWGEGDYAELAAQNTSHNGKLFFLMKK